VTIFKFMKLGQPTYWLLPGPNAVVGTAWTPGYVVNAWDFPTLGM
jgi:hypothetical protein